MQSFQDYMKEVPSNTGQQMAYAAAAAFIIRTVTSGSPQKGVVAAALSALATAVHGLISPFFKQIIGRNQLNWGEEMCRTMGSIIITGCVAAAYGDRSIFNSLVGLSIIYGFLTFMDPARCDLRRADWIPIFPANIPAN